jgi:hypothetical protein
MMIGVRPVWADGSSQTIRPINQPAEPPASAVRQKGPSIVCADSSAMACMVAGGSGPGNTAIPANT